MSIIAKKTGEGYPHGTQLRYLYELQLKRNGEGPDPCRACKDAHAADVKMAREIRSQILARFRKEYPSVYRDWFNELKEQHVARRSSELRNVGD